MVSPSPAVGSPRHKPTDAMVCRCPEGPQHGHPFPAASRGLQGALPEEGRASPAIALALEPLQTGDLPLYGAVTPAQRPGIPTPAVSWSKAPGPIATQPK